jgi:osmotically-inducible protein OsmY
VQQLLQRSLDRLQNHNIQVELHAQTVTLTGSVRSWSEKQLAQESVRSTTGSRTIHNELRVSSVAASSY